MRKTDYLYGEKKIFPMSCPTQKYSKHLKYLGENIDGYFL